ncbi:MAG: hypothetical protein WBZ45_13100 [Acidimicrobiia bacterium]
MGQTVVIREATTMGDVLLVDTDRSLTGQDGVVMTPESARPAVPGLLAERLFGLDVGIDHVFVLQNQVTIRRVGGWDEESRAAALSVVEGFLLHY